MEKQKEYSYNSSPCKVGLMQLPITSPEDIQRAKGSIEGIPLDDSTNEEIERQWQHVETSLAILRNLHIERANMEFWTRFEMITKGRENK